MNKWPLYSEGKLADNKWYAIQQLESVIKFESAVFRMTCEDEATKQDIRKVRNPDTFYRYFKSAVKELHDLYDLLRC